MINKVLRVILICLLIVTTVSCGTIEEKNYDSDNKTLEEIACDTYTQMRAFFLQKHDVDIEADMEINVNNAIVRINAKWDVKVIIEKSQMQQCSILTELDLGSGDPSETVMQFNGKKSYFAMNGVEEELEIEQVLDYYKGQEKLTSAPDLTADMIKSVNSRGVDGDTETTIVFDAEKISDIEINLFNAIANNLIGDISNTNVLDMTIVLVADPNNLPKTMRIEFARAAPPSFERKHVSEDKQLITPQKKELSFSITYTFNILGHGVKVDTSKLSSNQSKNPS